MSVRELGNSLGNPLALPKSTWQPESTTYTRIVSGSGVLIPPQGAKLMRVAVIGGGACGYYNGTVGFGGCGGGCAASKIVPASSITYSIGAGGNTTTQKGGDTTASFIGYELIGGGGNSSYLAPPYGGVGKGGDYNYSGGSAISTTSLCGGGGGAGPGGPGGDGGPGQGSETSFVAGWGAKGGQGSGTGLGAGTGAFSPPSSPATNDMFAVYPWGSGITDSVANTTAGVMGGGGRSGATTGWSTIGLGGSGGMVVEWFY